jgi:hypothetical protein
LKEVPVLGGREEKESMIERGQRSLGRGDWIATLEMMERGGSSCLQVSGIEFWFQIWLVDKILMFGEGKELVVGQSVYF